MSRYKDVVEVVTSSSTQTHMVVVCVWVGSKGKLLLSVWYTREI